MTTILGIDPGKNHCDWCLYTEGQPVLDWHHGFIHTDWPLMLQSMGANTFDMVAVEGFTMLPRLPNLAHQRQSELPRIIGRIEAEAAMLKKPCLVIPVAEIHRVLRIPRKLTPSGIKRARRAAVSLFCPEVAKVSPYKFRQHQIDALAVAITAASRLRTQGVIERAR